MLIKWSMLMDCNLISQQLYVYKFFLALLNELEAFDIRLTVISGVMIVSKNRLNFMILLACSSKLQNIMMHYRVCQVCICMGIFCSTHCKILPNLQFAYFRGLS